MTSGACTCSHVIEVVNLSEGEVVQQSLLLVKGRIQPLCANIKQQPQQLRATLKTEESIIKVKASEQLTQVSNAGEFKLLFDLEPELSAVENDQDASSSPKCLKYVLHLRYCSGELQQRFIYKQRLSLYRVQPLYLLCQDSATTTEELSKHCALIDLNLRLVQCIYSHKLRAAGYTNCTFTLNAPCEVFRSQLTTNAAYCSSEDELWQYFATEILASAAWGQQLNLKFVAFIGCTRYDGEAVVASGDYSYANIRRHLKGHAALGGGGLALFGSAFFYAWPQRFSEIGDCIRSTQRVDLTRMPDESNYRRTYGGVYASTLGAVCHELGHCFDLGHTEDGIMGHGFDYLNRVLTVDKCTEYLPNRIVHRGVLEAPTTPAIGSARPRFTQLKPLKQRMRNKYLDKYHEQRKNDSFYFTRNCAVILAQHKWLRAAQLVENELDIGQTQSGHIELSSTTAEITSNVPLRLVELRCNLNSLVAHYVEFANDDVPDYRFQLPQPLWDLVSTQHSHYIFVLTTTGETKRLTCDKNQ